MKKLIILIICFSFSIYCKAQSGQSLYGDECAVLNVKTILTDYGDHPRESEYEGDNMEFENEHACRKYYNHNYDYYPFDDKSCKFRGEIQIKYLCVPCSLAYEGKKVKPERDKKCGSSAHNAQKFTEAKSCFTNEDSFNDALNALKKIDCNTYTGDVTCEDGKIHAFWYKKDANGNKSNVPESDRKSIDDFYDDLKRRSNNRQANQLGRQIKGAQSEKERSDLAEQLRGLLKGLGESGQSSNQNGASNNNGNSHSSNPNDSPEKDNSANKNSSGSENKSKNDKTLSPEDISTGLATASDLLNDEENKKLLGGMSGAIDWAGKLKALEDYLSDPHDEAKTRSALTTLGSLAASKGSNVSGSGFDTWIAPIPDLVNNVMDAGINNMESLLNTGDYDDKEVWRLTGNYLGQGLGMGNVGDYAKDYTKEGDKSWGQLTDEYGWYEGSKKSIWNYFLNDLKRNNTYEY